MLNLRLDHLAVSAESRDAARAHIEDTLGMPMQSGGSHARFGTHNHLMGLQGGLYLEGISIDPDAPDPDRARWFDLDNFAGAPRLSNWICAVPDLRLACAAMPDAGEPVELERGELHWKMAVPLSGKLSFGGMFPPLIEWQGALHPAKMLTPTAARLTMLTVRLPLFEELKSTLGAISGASVRFEKADAPELIAEFETPHGLRVLA